jgi:hypothetical protein
VCFLIGIFMFMTARVTNKLVNDSQSQSDVLTLAIIFFLFTVLVATQDVGIDGWSISLLSKENIHWQAICSGTGQTLGYIVGNTLFVLLHSVEFCNDNVRPWLGLANQDYAILSMEGERNVILFGIIKKFCTSRQLRMYVSN